MLQIAILISGNGSNLQALINHSRAKGGSYSITAVIADREAEGLKRAKNAGIETFLIDRKIGNKALSAEIHRLLDGRVDLVVLAGFLSILEGSFTERWKRRVINIHPALLPAFGGRRMYGIHVHRAVIQAGVEESGCTVHYVDSGIDSGEIISQMRLKIGANWDANRLQKEVLKIEHRLLPETVERICREGVMTDKTK